MPRPKGIDETSVGSSHCTGQLSSSSCCKHVGDNADLLSLPPHLWCLVGLWIDAVDSASALQCSAWLWAAFNVEALWLQQCLANSFARLVDGPDGGWIYPFLPQVKVGRCVDWRRLLCANMRHRLRPFIWARFKDVDLRLPVPADMQSAEALVAQLGQIVMVDGSVAPEASAAAGLDLRRSPAIEARWALRPRRLQWGGRPGPVLREGASLLGGHFLLEWCAPSGRGWPLPPALQPVALQQAPTPTARSAVSSSFSSRLRCQGVPVLAWLHGGAGAAPEAPVSAPTPQEPEALMLRVLTLLVPRELWLCVHLTATWSHLCREIDKTLRHESPLVGDLSRPITYHLMDMQKPQQKVEVPETTPLRDLFWAQSETVRVELESGRQGRGSNDTCLSALIWREQAFVEVPEFVADTSGAVPSSLELAAPWSRHMSEPVPAQSSAWSRQMSEPLPTQSLQAVNLDASTGELGRQISEPAPLPGLPNTSWFPAAGARRSTTGVADAPVPEQSPSSTDGVGSHSTLDSTSLPEGPLGTWEHIVPHYAPQLLPSTLLTRQFEFHPTLPEVMLTGDRKGSVNILNSETDEVHPPLVTGMCPVLGLVWMQHHPQKAVCGSSHSGKIMFLRYDPHARPSEPVLQRVQTVEEFPKLSSLSSNCTDDFLLASGISPNIAVYDIHTGKVLHRAHGVHEHFINISRFCHNSPHIFATASFDHTCKVWDLRRPLLHDRPVKTLNTGSHNVMCVFSRDDRHVLCSGVDTRITQFEVPSWRQTPEHFPMRDPVHRERYRRSTYLATSRHFATAATEESHMHLMTVEGKKLGVVDFRGVVQQWADRSGQNTNSRNSSQGPCCFQVPRLDGRSRSRTADAALEGQQWTKRVAAGRLLDKKCGEPVPQMAGHPHQSLVHGTVQLDDADPNGGSSRNNHEFIQSIRTHPLLKNRVAVLLSLTQAEQSYVAYVDIAPSVLH